jgi:hypothetical protein
LDRTLFWTTAELEDKLLDFRTYFNEHRSHTGLQGRTPDRATPCRDLSPVSIPMAGNAIAEASITHPWPPDSPKNSAPGGIRRKSANRTPTGNICCFVLLSAPRLADLILSLPPSAFRYDSPSAGQRSPAESVRISIRH